MELLSEGDIKVDIFSTGYYMGHKEVIRFYIPFTPPDEVETAVPPLMQDALDEWENWEDDDEYVYGEDYGYSNDPEIGLGWSEPDGQNIVDNNGELQEADFAVVFDTDKNNIISPRQGLSAFKAPAFHFEQDILLQSHSTLILYSQIIVFHENVRLNADSKLCLFLRPEDDFGFVWFKKGVRDNTENPDIPAGIYILQEPQDDCIPLASLQEYVYDDGEWGGGVWD